MLNMSVLPLGATTTASASGTAAGNGAAMLIELGSIALIFVVFYFILIRPQHKREKETDKMRKSLQVGDEIVTTGGVVGRIVSIKDDSLVIETGADRNKIRIKKWAVQTCETIHDDNN